jgi:small conductance mechanosensitive channel
MGLSLHDQAVSGLQPALAAEEAAGHGPLADANAVLAACHARKGKAVERGVLMRDALALELEMPKWAVMQPYVFGLTRVIAILVIAFVASRIAGRLILGLRAAVAGVMMRHGGDSPEAVEKRAATIGGLLRKTAIVLIWAVAIPMALKELGFDVGPLLAGAGVAGLAIGFGAQNLVRDVVSGFFMFLENQIRLNDIAVINGTSGVVEEINLRTTVLRSTDGAVHVFPNGAITTLSNMTMNFSYYVFEIGVAYKEDTDHVAAVMRETAETMRQEDKFAGTILEPLEVLGVDRFAESAVVIKARIKTKPMQQWAVGRELNSRFKKRFDELGIEIPFPQLSLVFGEANRPMQFRLDKDSREELKALIREVLAEKRG